MGRKFKVVCLLRPTTIVAAVKELVSSRFSVNQFTDYGKTVRTGSSSNLRREDPNGNLRMQIFRIQDKVLSVNVFYCYKNQCI